MSKARKARREWTIAVETAIEKFQSGRMCPLAELRNRVATLEIASRGLAYELLALELKARK